MEKKFKKVLVANRGEIAIRIFRACHELGIRTVAIYTEEDKCALFRTKANESYQIGKGKGPVEAYLNIEEIIELALKKNVDAIHPGYGFLSENPEFARRCEEAGIEFIGPKPEMMEKLGDKIQSKLVAESVGVQVIPGLEEPITTDEKALEAARYCGYPVMVKAAAGGGGRGMRIVRREEELLENFHNAKNEAKKAFGIDDIFIEKYIERPKHIEVQVLGDKYGNIVHLYERDCSIQRRHQKVIEFTPAITLTEEKRQEICNDALKIAKSVNYRGAGTLEFLVDATGNHYFIEMNPRVQVEHTITEMTTGIDIVQSQILIAEGYSLDSKEVGIPSQDSISTRGYAIQCRITTEDPTNNFAPDTGKIDVYRSGGGFGIRNDGGNGFAGAEITPYYDSLLVKTTAYSRTFEDTIRKSIRAIKEIMITGVKTNIDFLINVLNNEQFKQGTCDTNFIADNPQLFDINPRTDEEQRLLKFVGERVVNVTKGNKKEFDTPIVPAVDEDIIGTLRGTKQILDEQGPQGVVDFIKNQNKLLLTDTTMRDAQQSLIATRVRSVDMSKIAKPTAVYGQDLFSLEMWGGATFDVAYRFLNESPWRRLQKLREEIPDILFQMLFRASNGVGYTNYPDNVITEFIKESAKQGIDVIRIFDSLNWVENMKLSIDAGLETGKIVEATMCYTGDILDPSKSKYNLEYYIKMAQELEALGTDIICIKDMAGLLKPHAAYSLVKALKENVSTPIHLHTHDTSGNGVATCLMASKAGVDIIDTALQSMAGLTSQPSLNAIVEALRFDERDTKIDLYGYEQISDYYYDLREVYKKFESGLTSSFAQIYQYEMPGGQYSNLKAQADSLGLKDEFDSVKENYQKANKILGDIIKVTPSSKVVGDLAIFMTKNKLDEKNIIEEGKKLSFPDSVVDYCKGMIGQPVGGIPQDLQEVVLKGEAPITERPGKLMPLADFEADKKYLNEKFSMESNIRNILSYELYPKVYEDYLRHLQEYNDISKLESHVFFYGLDKDEECDVEIEEGKSLSIRLIGIGEVKENGYRTVVFRMNGSLREVEIKDNNFSGLIKQVKLADMNDPLQIGAAIPGKVVKTLVKKGDIVEENQPLIVIEAMKMETNIVAKVAGKISSIEVEEGDMVTDKQLLMTMEAVEEEAVTEA